MIATTTSSSARVKPFLLSFCFMRFIISSSLWEFFIYVTECARAPLVHTGKGMSHRGGHHKHGQVDAQYQKANHQAHHHGDDGLQHTQGPL